MSEAHEAVELTVEEGAHPERPKAPLVPGAPLVGSAFTFLRDPVRFFLSAYRTYGPVYRVSLGPTTSTCFAGMEGSAFLSRAGRTLVTSDGVWDGPSRIMGADRHANMTNVDGDRHTALRGHFRASMSKTEGYAALPMAMEIARKRFEEVVEAGRPIDAVELARRITFEQLGRSLAGEAPPAMYDAASTVLDEIVRVTRIPLLARFPVSRATRRAAGDVRAIADRLLALPSAAQPTFVREIVHALQSGLVKESDLPLLMLTPFIAGLDTMAHTFGFVLYRLAMHPEWRARLADELDAVVGTDGRMDEETLARCVELSAFVQEVMRLHPLSPVLMRIAAADFVVNGYRVEAGERLMFPHTVPHLMHEVFPDPERFDPERFIKGRPSYRGQKGFAPFGLGSHICLGAGIAEVLIRSNTAAAIRAGAIVAADPGYRLRVSNTSGAKPVGFRVRVTPNPTSAPRSLAQAS